MSFVTVFSYEPHAHFHLELHIKVMGYFWKVFVTTMSLYKCTISKWLAVVLVGNKFNTGISVASHIKISKLNICFNAIVHPSNCLLYNCNLVNMSYYNY